MNAHTSSPRWNSRVALAAIVAILGLTLAAQDADARRMGGGRSFGRQAPTQQQAQPPSKSTSGQTATQPGQTGAQAQAQAPRNRWLGPIAGLAAGLGIFALLSHLGLTEQFAEMLGSFLLIALVVFAAVFIWRKLRGARNQPSMQRRMEPAYDMAGTSGMAGAGTARPGSVAAMDHASTGSQPASTAPPAPWGVPADFDVDAFLRNAKVYFIRLQAAWDAKNLDDIREFTTPEVYAEIKMQIEDDKGVNNQTEVVDLDAELLGIETTGKDYLASVRYSGTIREGDRGTAEPFVEAWNLSKPKDGRSGWVLAGLQQIR